MLGDGPACRGGGGRPSRTPDCMRLAATVARKTDDGDDLRPSSPMARSPTCLRPEPVTNARTALLRAEMELEPGLELGAEPDGDSAAAGASISITSFIAGDLASEEAPLLGDFGGRPLSASGLISSSCSFLISSRVLFCCSNSWTSRSCSSAFKRSSRCFLSFSRSLLFATACSCEAATDPSSKIPDVSTLCLCAWCLRARAASMAS